MKQEKRALIISCSDTWYYNRNGRPERQRNKIVALGLDRLINDAIITDELGGVQFRKPCDIAFYYEVSINSFEDIKRIVI